MSLKFLPAPVVVISAFALAVILFYQAKKSWNQKNQPLSIAYILFALAGIGGGLSRYAEESNLLGSNLGTVQVLSGILGIAAVLVTVIGALLTVKDPKKRSTLKIIVVSMGIIMMLCVILLVVSLKMMKVSQ